MKGKNVFRYSSLALFLAIVAVEARSEDKYTLPLDALVGKFVGTIQVDKANPIEHLYRTEVVSVDRLANTVSLTANCEACGVKNWKRSNCEITLASENIRFICRGTVSNEEYIFDGDRMNATGFGNKYPYSIRVTKVSGNTLDARR